MSKPEYNQNGATYNGAFALSTMKDGKRVWAQNVDYTGFTLEAIIPGFDQPFALVEKTIGEGENAKQAAVPQYEDSKVNYLQESLTARIEAAAKGRVNGGNAPYATLEEILETTGGGQYRKLHSEFKAGMAQFMDGNNIAEALQAAVIKLLEPDVLRATSEANKGKVDKLVDAFSTANPEHAAKYASVIKRVKEAAEQSATMDLGELEL